MFPFYNPDNVRKTRGFLMFSGDTEENIGLKWVNTVVIQAFELYKILENSFHNKVLQNRGKWPKWFVW